MGRLRRAFLGVVSEVAWRLPGWPARLLAEFSLAERGSMVDMLAAADATTRRDLRRKYFLHALDEGRHAAVFADRAQALAGGRRGSRAQAATEDAGLLQSHGIVGGQTLFDWLGEPGFLAFVHVAEADAVEQFGVYLDRGLPDADTRAVLIGILRDEAFHVSYSRAECDRYRREGLPIDRMIAGVRWRRGKDAWLRATRDLGEWVSGFWLLVVYVMAVGPFRLFARLEPGGWQRPAPGPSDLRAAARMEG